MSAPTDQAQQRARRAERFRFPLPIAATLADRRVVLNDLSSIGAGIMHNRQLGREFSGLLHFEWEGRKITMQCSVVRTSLERERHGGIALTVYHSGLIFTEPLSEEEQQQRELLREKLAQALDQQRSNAYGVPIEMVRHLPVVLYAAEEEVVTAPSLNLNDLFILTRRPSGLFIRCSLEGERWVQSRTDSSEQPLNGFTVSADEREKDLDTLCWTYQQTNAEGRKLIRTFAHLSLVDPGDTPRDLYGA